MGSLRAWYLARDSGQANDAAAFLCQPWCMDLGSIYIKLRAFQALELSLLVHQSKPGAGVASGPLGSHSSLHCA